VARRQIPVNVGPRVVDFYGVGDGRFHGIAAEYDAAGVQPVSVNTDSFNFGQTYLAVKAAMAARFGMDDAAALRSVTIEPARALLLADRLGSIEVGKDADLIIKQTNIIDPTTPVEMVFVDGQLAYEYETRG
jgi:imidazolonepropionase-like amidohydrolase